MTPRTITLATGAALALVTLLGGCAPVPRPSASPPMGGATTGIRTATPTAGRAPIAGTNAWLGYHSDAARTGAVAAGASIGQARVAWSADLGGAVQGQPVAADGRIIAATETDRVVALDPTTGAIAWSASLGSPLTDVSDAAGCGDIDPLGITSTPAIDVATGTVYVVGEVDDGGGSVHHQLEGFDIATGKVVLSEAVDPPLPAGEDAVNLLQRASLAVANGRVYIGYGGNFGDCGDYHGWLVSVAESGPPALAAFEVASDGQGGAIWQGGGAPAVDANGNVYVTTGNANPDPPEGGPDPLAFTESVVKLSPTLQPLASSKDQTAGGDEDLSTGNPVLLPDGDVFAVGKTNIGYVLTQAALTQVSAIDGVCDSDPDGGPAYDAATNRLFVPCRGGGIQVVDLAAGSAGAMLQGANGPPILVGRTLWSLQYPAGTLTEFDADTGAVSQSIDLGVSVPAFATPSRAFGVILVGTTAGVIALG